MATTPTTITKGATIEAGETMILPEGAVILNASGELSSDCITIPDAEDLLCYIITWVTTLDGDGFGTVSTGLAAIPFDFADRENAWDTDLNPITVNAINVNNTKTTITAPVEDLIALKGQINAISSVAILQDRKYTYETYQNSYGDGASNSVPNETGKAVWHFWFKSFASVAETVYLQFEGASVGTIPRYYATAIDCDDYPTVDATPSAC